MNEVSLVLKSVTVLITTLKEAQKSSSAKSKSDLVALFNFQSIPRVEGLILISREKFEQF